MLANRDKMIKGDDVWVPTVCAGCYNCCGIRVHRVNGKVVEVKGDPRCRQFQRVYLRERNRRALDVHHPSRVTKPLKRTNPEKGIGVDPGWEEISLGRGHGHDRRELQKIRADDPAQTHSFAF